MAVPKRKKSKMRVRQRKGQVKAIVAEVQACPNCGSPRRIHRACGAGGFYNARQVVAVEAEA
jgi:large subunit ribosomal protein L32